MKKILYCLCGAAMLAFSACQSDEIAPVTDSNDASVVFLTELPSQMSSRAVSDGTTCQHLNVTVYDENGHYVFDCGNQYENAFAGSNLTQDVELKLVVGKTYKIVFWAFAPGAPYEFDAQTATLDMNYDLETNVAQNEDRDMFFHMEEIEVKGDIQKSIPLVRPFAQVNIGTTLADYQAAVRAGASVTTTGATFTTDVYNTLNLLTGEASNPVSVEMGIAPIITTGLEGTEDDMVEPLQLKSGEKYVHLSMNYLLMNNKGREAISSVKMHTNGTEDKIFGNVPVERNYRTNIVGELFSANMTYNVYISPEYDGEYNEWSVWDGETVEAPVQDPENPTNFTVNTAAQFVGMLQAFQQVPANQRTKVVITLDKDIDLAGNATPALGSFNNAFEGTLDGNGHTLTGLSIKWGENNGEPGLAGHSYGLIHTAKSGSTFKDIEIDGEMVAYYEGHPEYYVGNLCGGLVGTSYGNVTFENITVKNTTVSGYGKVGAILGMGGDAGGTTTFKNCKVNNCTIVGVYNLAGLAGLIQNKCVIENCEVEGVTFQTPEGETYTTLNNPATTDVTKQAVTIQGDYWVYPTASYTVYYATNSKYYNYFVKAGMSKDNDIMIEGLGEGLHIGDGLCYSDLDTPQVLPVQQ